MKIPKSSANIQNLPYHILVEYHFSSENEDTYLQDMPKHTLEFILAMNVDGDQVTRILFGGVTTIYTKIL